MMNRFQLVGVVKSYSNAKKNEKENSNMFVQVKVKRFYGEVGTEFKSDIFEVVLSDGIAKECLSHIKVDDLIGIMGHMETEVEKTWDGREVYAVTFIAENVSFLNSEK